ncbi:uncharacterized protein Z520_01309 [Fonsecaea multimorphosa CBS 102226]|uniref:Uncharacterized protein n=1 Tax=Fonsecaea multimorphosa CBS 102226 TaxID=1442371 RepID=A0A0D2L1C9_9EURO|nr:uncharacterized protein Z520_01309 [Fonsecaea multimorphosa CBS 102226]KIY02844.1 hypothetical protein Z520_01309 [Fonsecaea multimorphosa CBS 102226]OAL31008.1 hypothetical protein AYO22_01303 [Fonsecaea multimorphosa]
MRKPCIPELIYQRTFPKPKQGDPVSFYAHIQRHIVGEVRVEVQNFYGALDTLEAQYPGLDYTFAPHRRRLSRYPWHRRLFRVLDELGLTADEILNLCQWEGTRAAKERYEREAGVEVRTTTADDVVAALPGNGPRAVFEDLSQPEPVDRAASSSETLVATPEEEEYEAKDVDSPASAPEDEVMDLLRDAMQSGLRGDSAAWEQWLKETLERHDEIDLDLVMTAIRDLEPETLRAIQQAGEGNETMSRSPTPQSHADAYHEANHLDRVETDSTHVSTESTPLSIFARRSQTEAAR